MLGIGALGQYALGQFPNLPAVNNPPFQHPSKLQQTITEISYWQPDTWPVAQKTAITIAVMDSSRMEGLQRYHLRSHATLEHPS